MLSRSLSRFATSISYDDIPDEAVQKAKICYLDWLLVTYLAAREGASRQIEKVVMAGGGANGPCTLIGRSARSTPLNAALVNGFNSHYLDYDDMHIGLNGHPSAAIYPAVMAATELRAHNGENVEGRKVIAAYVAGAETACRLGIALNPSHYDLGWHATSTIGAIAAAVGGARILGCDESQTLNAVGFAATQSAGLRGVFGAAGKPLNVGRAASSGLLAAMLAKEGLTSEQEVLDGAKGFCSMVSESWSAESVSAELGKRFHMQSTIIKEYPACYSAHPAIQAAAEIRRKHRFPLSDIQEVKVTISPMTKDVARFDRPRNAMEARFSASFCAAIGLRNHDDPAGGFTDGDVASDEVRDLLKKIVLVVDPSIRHDQRLASVDVKLLSGPVYHATADLTARGLGNVDSWALVRRKMASAASRMQRVGEWQLAAIEDAKSLSSNPSAAASLRAWA